MYQMVSLAVAFLGELFIIWARNLRPTLTKGTPC